MHSSTKPNLKPTSGETGSHRSRLNTPDRFAPVIELQQMMLANQGLPFLRGHFPPRGIQYSALND